MEIYNSSLDSKFDLLDQTSANSSNIGIGESNTTTEALLKELKRVVDNESQICGFTFTFKRAYHQDDDLWLHRHVEKCINSSRVWKDIKYIMFSEFNASGQLHYHGIIYGEYDIVVMRIIKWWRRKYGFAKVELKLHNKLNWVKYICKDYLRTGLWTLNRF